ncbi:MAG: hypothetical protein QNJ92_10370 [Alphaproteobacteria bacterium]|nr:hypothetical protein [Alphaproteobacteria bacterium]
MTKPTHVLLLLAGLCLAAPTALGDQHLRREPISLPKDVKAIFLAQMLGHVVALDGVVTALGKGDYQAASDIAASEMGSPRIADTGGTEGPGLGIGKYMPEKFRAITKDFKSAADDFAALARSMPAEPSAEQHRALAASLSGITKQCRVCHDTFRVE